MAGLNVSDVVRVDINLSPVAAPLRSFGSLLIAGSSDVIDTNERIRQYTTLNGVAQDFGAAAPEFKAADLFFSQRPQPSILYIGRAALNPTKAILHGAIFYATDRATLLRRLQTTTNGTMQITIDGTVRTVAASAAYLRGGAFAPSAQAALLTTLQALTDGTFGITVDGVTMSLPGIDFSAITDLTGAATLINDAFAGRALAVWETSNGLFRVTSPTTGTASTIDYATGPTAGTDISTTIRLTAATSAVTVQGGTGMDFTAITNLNGAASIITSALSGGTCWFDGTRFHIQSASMGPTSTISFASAAGTGTDVSGPLRLTEATGALIPVDGRSAETPLEAAIALRAYPTWYGLMFATEPAIDDIDKFLVANFIEGANPMSIYGYTTADTNVLELTVTSDIASQMHESGFSRTFGQYSSTNPHAVASLFGRAFTVDFEGSNTTLTLKFKTEPGVVPEDLTETQANALQFKRCNVYVYYANDTAIVQEGVMSNGFFFDEVHGTDWLQNRIQTDVYNLLYTAPTKIPQTNQGVHMIVTVVESSLAQGVVNGLIAPGQWNAPGFGQIVYGQMLSKGYYVWAPLVESQPQAIREQRVAPTIQCAVKLAGAIHRAYVIVNVNR
jgi:hypothetical protein